MNPLSTRLSAGGRIVLPAQMRANLGIKEGDELLLTVADGEIRITPKALALKNALELARLYVATESSLSDALIAERRSEAAGE
ncbi:MAG: AbrB/MazE/SpoVT family DNA-binding domain-containing protein [Methylococcaceae bacterium]|nr:AbrB/MazE/SpoVT family DNA-binding domain-containing protein [Methylococcaceae bacterium]